MEIWTLWLIIAGFFAILEIFTVGFLVIWIGAGALLAMIVSFFFPKQIVLQIAIWVISSIILILLTRKFAEKVEPKATATNVYSIIGKKAYVTKEINNLKSQGQIKINGDTWSARSENPEGIIPIDSEVEIVRIEGVKAIVKLCVNSNSEVSSK